MSNVIFGPSIEYLRLCFDFDDRAGVLRWKNRPLAHFESAWKAKIWHKRFLGTEAGTKNNKGYRVVSLMVDGVKQTFKVHRVIWAMHTGAWPVKAIDHINGVKDDNRPANLREATRAENGRNRPMLRTNQVGVKGVCRIPLVGGGEKYTASIKNRAGKQVHLGRFDSIDDARDAYIAAAIQEHREFAHV